ncbi:FIST signal transduction protein [Marinospirillum alkaliphilum]|uniref:Uncharacterized conserved protein, contains FIST_N domain n=1 Tax=Marinospirillum alkaliphilum DSM 21637 TaxID=1122209 RepID=A0A1K1X3R9_9GAMM|nr:FIST C-terminal domain-containing protein [Marinospirillum alkaliphilum]SFX43804.1 Uncharacterized conserved protein, contains FIST_N domain [Marinospirillum alkaliphilum DSM 21637]
MKIHFIAEPDIQAFQAGLEQLANDPTLQSVLVFAADANQWTADQLDPLLQQTRLQVVGGIFPQIIHEQQNYTEGAVLVALPWSVQWQVIPRLSDTQADFDTPLSALADAWEALEGPSTHLVLVDGLATCIATLVESLFINFGLERNYLGGGAGSLSFVQKPCLLTPQGLCMDAALLIRLPLASGIGVAHGWQAISEPMKVTAAHKNLVQQLDWKPAFETYRSLVEPHAGQAFTDSNFFDIAKAYPFGISKLDSEMVVRDPLMLKDQQSMVCVGEVPEGAFVRVLNGTPETLIAAAGQAASLARQAWDAEQTSAPQLACFIDCISRVLFMEQQIVEEFAQVAGDYPLVGALTLGEIANSGRDYLEFYNKTAVLGLLGKA